MNYLNFERYLVPEEVSILDYNCTIHMDHKFSSFNSALVTTFIKIYGHIDWKKNLRTKLALVAKIRSYTCNVP